MLRILPRYRPKEFRAWYGKYDFNNNIKPLSGYQIIMHIFTLIFLYKICNFIPLHDTQIILPPIFTLRSKTVHFFSLWSVDIFCKSNNLQDHSSESCRLLCLLCYYFENAWVLAAIDFKHTTLCIYDPMLLFKQPLIWSIVLEPFCWFILHLRLHRLNI